MLYSEIGPINSKKKYFLVHYDNGLGWYFFDWSIKYLSGKNKDFLFADQKYSDLLQNPVGPTTAHKHKVSFVYSRKELLYYDSMIKSLDDDCCPVILQGLINEHTVATGSKEKKNLSGISSEQREKLVDEANQAFLELTKLALDLGYIVITILWSNDHKLIPGYQIRQPVDFCSGQRLGAEADPYKLWVDTFFSGSEQKFDQEIWDQRELLALCTRPFFQLKKINFANNLISAIPDIISINTDKFWVHGANLFTGIAAAKYQSWIKVYKHWQRIHDTKLSKDYWTILSSIINNKSMDLSRYNLDLVKEALIQHGLIYKYNLNLKTWNLDKFPDNTRDLYQLLEENMHVLDTEYKLSYCENF